MHGLHLATDRRSLSLFSQSGEEVGYRLMGCQVFVGPEKVGPLSHLIQESRPGPLEPKGVVVAFFRSRSACLGSHWC
nr:hypothetical protein [Prochlorococcus marinus]